jgi:thiol-disulfide isomerase/thioredoxin
MHFSLRLLGATLLLGFAISATAQPFEFKDMQGNAQRLNDYRGKWVLVNFWATWCPPCLEEVPDLVALHEAHKKIDLVVIGVALDSTEKSVKAFVAKRNVTYPIVLGDYEMAEQVGKIEVLPTSYLYNPQGELVSYQEGLLSRASVESYVKSKNVKK